jgi:predicted AlkP superfamily phosphohydrolase/phosphomutase
LPTVKKPKLSGLERRTLNNAVEQVQEWVSENEAAVRAQAHAALDRVLVPLGEYMGRAHPAVDSAIGWATEKLAALKF